jgi:hypothetical protein
VTVLAAVRPHSWDFPLFLHVFGAMILVGGLVAGAGALGLARGDVRLLRLGYWSLLAVSLPGWILMRVGAEWIRSKEGWDDLPKGIAEPDWLTTGSIIADVGGAVLLVSLVVGAVGVRRLGTGKGAGALTATLALSFVLLAAYVVAVWAMSAKPD